jgi:spore germination protein GerM
VLLLAAALAASCGNPENVVPETREAEPDPAALEAAEAELRASNQLEVTLYFLTADGEMLAPERRRIFRTSTVTDRARQTVQALLDGPEGPRMRSLPPGTRLQEIFVAEDGTAYVDLAPEFGWGIETGSSDAVFAVYALVNTLAANFEEIHRVKLLIDGEEVQDVGGHLDLSRPILPEMSMVDTH